MSATYTNDERNQLIEDSYNQYYQIIYHFCLSKINYQTQFACQIEDCIQDAFVMFAMSYETLASHPNPAGWLCHAAWNKLRTKIRNNNSRRKKLEDEAALLAPSSEAQNAIERWLSQEENRHKLTALYALLTDTEQAVYQRYFVDDLSLADTTAKTGLSENSVRSAIERIRKRARGLNKLFIFFLFFECIIRFSRTK